MKRRTLTDDTENRRFDSPLPENETEKPAAKAGAYLVGVTEAGEDPADAKEHLEELKELASALKFPVAGQMMTAIRQAPHPKYYVGSGKAEEIAKAAKETHAEVIVFDTELGASQQRNLERLTGLNVVDRQEIILDIFAERARTREAVLQVELARNKYFLPRLTRAWSHLSRQHGGAMGTRGEGEKQIEYDRRMVKLRISQLEKELSEVRKQRNVQRKGRIRKDLPLAAIVGYTNAGKSSLLNRLTGADALVEDQLFATLDPTTRKFILPNHGELILTDTVGFIRKLPHSLVEAFKSTLEEAVLADFLVMVLDISNPEAESHWKTTLSVLTELGAEKKPMLTVFNKCDRQNDPLVRLRMKSMDPNGVFVSCRTGEGLDMLGQALIAFQKKHSDLEELLVPPDRPDIVAALHSRASLLEGKYLDDGTFACAARIPYTQTGVFSPFYKNRNIQPTEDSI